MAIETYTAFYEIKGIQHSIKFSISGNLKEADLGMSARAQIRKKHPDIEDWEIKNLVIN